MRGAQTGIAGLVVFVVLGAAGFLPLFAGPGYESALAAGVVVPLVVAIRVALVVAGSEASPFDSVRSGLRTGAVLMAIAYVTMLLHGLRSGFCGFLAGTALVFLGPFAGALVAGVWGAAAGLLARRLRRRRLAAVVLAIAGPIGSALVDLGFLYFTPVVFLFDPFAGFFSGTIYDTVIDGAPRLLTYRAGTLLTLLASLGVAFHLGEKARFRGFVSVATIAAAVGSLALVACGSHLDHWHTAATIRRELGAVTYGQRCVVVRPRTMRAETADLFARDCDEEIAAVSSYLGVVDPPMVTAFLFGSADEKRRLMGAADTYVAKPWRGEVYVQASGYPHPILGHELAHVLGARFGKWPVYVAGRVRGLIPDPGLIEGFAVAASPDDDELSPEEWARAMLDQGLLPPLRAIFSFGFLTQSSSRAYTVAGAFVGFVHDRFGAPAVARWYAGESLEAVTGEGLDQLEQRFRDHLAELVIPPEARALAKSRFDRPAIFARTCPHELDAERRDADVRFGEGDFTGAKGVYEHVLGRDPHDARAQFGRAATCSRLLEISEADRTLRAIATGEGWSRQAKDRADEGLGDAALAAGDLEAARARYDAVAGRVLDEDQLRTLVLKSLATTDAELRAALLPLLIGDGHKGPDAPRAMEELGRWSERRPDAMIPLYLLGKNAANRGDYGYAARVLEEAIAHPSSLLLVNRETARQLVIAGCALGDRGRVDAGLAAWSSFAPLRGNRDAKLRALAARCLR